jgi:hypothetical protein
MSASCIGLLFFELSLNWNGLPAISAPGKKIRRFRSGPAA